MKKIHLFIITLMISLTVAACDKQTPDSPKPEQPPTENPGGGDNTNNGGSQPNEPSVGKTDMQIAHLELQTKEGEKINPDNYSFIYEKDVFTRILYTQGLNEKAQDFKWDGQKLTIQISALSGGLPVERYHTIASTDGRVNSISTDEGVTFKIGYEANKLKIEKSNGEQLVLEFAADKQGYGSLYLMSDYIINEDFPFLPIYGITTGNVITHASLFNTENIIVREFEFKDAQINDKKVITSIRREQYDFTNGNRVKTNEVEMNMVANE